MLYLDGMAIISKKKTKARPVYSAAPVPSSPAGIPALNRVVVMPPSLAGTNKKAFKSPVGKKPLVPMPSPRAPLTTAPPASAIGGGGGGFGPSGVGADHGYDPDPMLEPENQPTADASTAEQGTPNAEPTKSGIPWWVYGIMAAKFIL